MDSNPMEAENINILAVGLIIQEVSLSEEK